LEKNELPVLAVVNTKITNFRGFIGFRRYGVELKFFTPSVFVLESKEDISSRAATLRATKRLTVKGGSPRADRERWIVKGDHKGSPLRWFLIVIA
jgi:hypothetical protein